MGWERTWQVGLRNRNWFRFALHFHFLKRNSLKVGFAFRSADRICLRGLCVLAWENRHGGSVCVNHGQRYCTVLEARSSCNIETDRQVSSVFYLQLTRKFNTYLTAQWVTEQVLKKHVTEAPWSKPSLENLKLNKAVQTSQATMETGGSLRCS